MTLPHPEASPGAVRADLAAGAPALPRTWLVRHGESESNAGLPTLGPGAAPLTARGRAQAARVAAALDAPPALIVASPFTRARETAEPARKRFPDAPYEEWAVQEFTYLGAFHAVNSTVDQRRPHSVAYWERAEPDLRLGGDGETFTALIARARAFLDRLAARPAGPVAVFTHRLFLLAVTWTLTTGITEPDADDMRAFRQYARTVPTPNASVVEVSGGAVRALDAPGQP
ncbi:histidine phosphatase family protein [Actinomadura atramentaria]|uniref:histidine phosphatase family protein n=1 Tax=Actinomadura atramentaria TaxID=1990 RepID=UPI0003751AA2|nr:histidine phosphatase family protein [Actinomadura atramentaria]